jgi:hypothetical protein
MAMLKLKKLNQFNGDELAAERVPEVPRVECAWIMTRRGLWFEAVLSVKRLEHPRITRIVANLL